MLVMGVTEDDREVAEGEERGAACEGEGKEVSSDGEGKIDLRSFIATISAFKKSSGVLCSMVVSARWFLINQLLLKVRLSTFSRLIHLKVPRRDEEKGSFQP